MPYSDGYREKILEAIQSRCPAILSEWIPGGRVRAHQYVAGSIEGGEGESFTVGIKHPWLFKDWARPDEKGGDLIKLYAVKFCGGNYGEALRQLGEQFGMERPKTRHKDAADWDVICPVPVGAYECDAFGDPILPPISSTKGVSKYWAYTSATGELLCFRLRFEPPGRKKVTPPLTYCRNRQTGQHEWKWRDLPVPRPLYGLMELAFSPEKVLIVEGCKKVDSGRRLLPGWCVITWSGSATGVDTCDWSPLILLDKSRIVIWPDNDRPGETAASHVKEVLKRPIEIVRPDPSWPEGWDLADLESAGWDTEKTEAYIAEHAERVVPDPPEIRPEVDITGKDHHKHQHAIYEAMRVINAEVYQHITDIVSIRRDAYKNSYLEVMDSRRFQSWATEHLDTFSYNGEKRKWPVGDQLAHAVIFNAVGKVPVLKRFAQHPIFCTRGKLLDTPGYHPEAQAYLSIPKNYDAELPLEEACGVVNDLLADFPFATDSDKACAIAFVLTGILRDMMEGPTPLFRFEAPSPGTGKSLLCRTLIEILAPYFGISSLSDDPSEVKKFITTEFRSNSPAIILDNVTRLDSMHLKMAISEYVWKDRILGQNAEIQMPVRCLWAVTVNNPQIDFEMFRRTVRVRLDAKVEHPEARDHSKFRHPNIVKYVRENRGLICSAFVSIAKAGLSYSEKVDVPRIGSYESWAERITPCMAAIGYPDFMSGREEDMRRVSDTGKESLHVFVHTWAQKHGTSEVTAKDLASLAEDIEGLKIKRTREGKISAHAMGWLLRDCRDQVFGDMAIRGPEHRDFGSVYWLEGDSVPKELQASQAEIW